MWSWHIFTVFILSQLLLSLVLFIQSCSVLSDWISSSLTVTILFFDHLLQYIFYVLYELHSSLATSVAHAAYAIKGFFSHFCVLLTLFSYSLRVTAMMFQLLCSDSIFWVIVCVLTVLSNLYEKTTLLRRYSYFLNDIKLMSECSASLI